MRGVYNVEGFNNPKLQLHWERWGKRFRGGGPLCRVLDHFSKDSSPKMGLEPTGLGRLPTGLAELGGLPAGPAQPGLGGPFCIVKIDT